MLVFAGGSGEVIADGRGNASTQTLAGNQMDSTAYIAIGPRTSSTVRSNAQVGMAPVELRVEKNSPRLNLSFGADGPIGSSLSVRYSLDGEQRTETVALPDGDTKTGSASFFVRVPSDNFHGFKLLGVSGAGVSMKEATPAGHSVMRNSTYNSSVELFVNSPK